MTRLLVLAATVTVGLVAGLLSAFAYAVMPGLRRTGDASFVSSMRGINIAIINPVFGVVFGGAVVLTVAAVVATRHQPAVFRWVLAALVLHGLAVVVTLAFNVPLNDRLEAGTGSAASLRDAFEGRWVVWNIVRSVASLGGFVSLVVATSLVGRSVEPARR